MSSNLSGQISSLNIGSTKSNNEEKDAATNDNCVAMCANCGKEGGDGSMNSCNKCDLVTYCNVACKKKHRSKHKKKCEKRVAELYDEKLFKDHPPPEECPICFLPLPLDDGQITFEVCCGKDICNGCVYAMDEKVELELCAFCRTPYAKSEKEIVKRIMKLMEKDNAVAYYQLAGYHAEGDMDNMGLPQDWLKANELYLKAGELGCAEAYFNLGYSYNYGEGVEIDTKKAMHYWELAAMNGSVNARHNLGYAEGQAGNHERAKKHFILAAKAGDKLSLDAVKEEFMDGIVTKDEYANTLRAYHERQLEMKSDTRDKALVSRNERMAGWALLGNGLIKAAVRWKVYWDLRINELYLKAGELGCAAAYNSLGYSYAHGTGVDIDMKKAKHYCEFAAMMGNVKARYNLGALEGRAGNIQRSWKHFVLAAKAGHKESLDVVKKGFMHGIVTKDDYASTLRAYQMRQDESKSDARGNANAYYQLFAG